MRFLHVLLEVKIVTLITVIAGTLILRFKFRRFKRLS